MQYNLISTDDHLVELPDTWTSRMSKAKWGDKIPHMEETPKGIQWVVWEQVQRSAVGQQVLGATVERTESPKVWDDVPRISYVPSERLKAMERDGVDVHTFFGNFTRGGTLSDPAFPDADFRLECIRAYNDYQMDVYADPYPGRFITLAVLPLWDVQEAVTEAKRMAQRGISGISFAFPQQFGYPHIADPYWDPLWAMAQETGLSINFHIGSGASMGIRYAAGYQGLHPWVKHAEDTTQAVSANTQVMTTLLFAGFMERFPNLKIVSAESGVGWVPYILDVADHQWQQQKLWKAGMPQKPSDYFHRQCYVNFWFEKIGTDMKERIGVDNIMWLSDFPHPTCTWPTSQDYLSTSLASFTPDEQRKVKVTNALKLYHLDKYQDRQEASLAASMASARA